MFAIAFVSMERGKPSRDYVGEDHCPACGHPIDSASVLFDETVRPSPGDLTVCLYCQTVLEFNPILKLQLADEAGLSVREKAYIERMRWAMKKAGPPPSARQSEN